MSYHRLSVKPLNVTLNTLMKRVAHVGLGVGAFTPILALANPTGGNVVAGQATIATPNANGLVINQASQSAIINWQQFSIGKGQYVQFLQPSSSSVVLNRVVGGNATSILGNLSANGQVFLVNPNGIFFGRGSMLDVQGIVASSLDIKNSDFLTGNYVFQKGTGANAGVVNQGSISTHNGGYVVLAGDYSENDGIIQARSGHVVLASGAKTTLTLSGNSLVNFAVNSATLAQLAGTDNTGSLIADGGTVVMTADVANALKATVVNNTGLIEAHAISKNNGTITLTATGGNIVNAGTLDADAGRAAQAGGNIVLKTDGRTNLTSTSKISATGNGADGGHLEVSGRSINVRGSATLGKGGNMLLDPGTMSISTGNKNSPGELGNTGSVGHIGVTFIDGQLNAGATVTISAAKAITHSGNVHAISAITGPNAGNGILALKAHTGSIELGGVDINIKGALTASFGYGNFGFIQAKSAAFTALNSAGFLKFHTASTSVNGAITKNSVKATGGDVVITGKTNVEGSGSNMYAIQATGNVNLGSAHIGNTSVAEMGITLVGKSVTDTGGIDIGSKVNVTATAGAVTLGDVTAFNNVTVAATGGNLTVGAVLTHNNGDNIILSDTTGNLSAGQIEAGGALTVTDTTGNTKLGDIAAYGGALTITDTTGNMTVGIVSGHGVTLNDNGHTLSFDHSAGTGNATVFANGALTLKAATIQTAASVHALDLKASSGGAITVKGNMSLVNKDLVIDDAEGGTISVNHNIAAQKVTLTGTQLAFIGTGPSFSISAKSGNLTLDAAIGTSTPVTGGVKYNVNLKDTGYGIFIEKSIFTGNTAGGLAANVTATETGHIAPLSGVLVGNHSGGSVTVQAAGNVILKGWNVGVGHVIGSSAGTFGAITVRANKNLLFSAGGTGSHGGNVGIQAQNTTAGSDTRNTSIQVLAGGALKLVGKQVDIRAGNVRANMHGSAANGTASATANVTVKAAGNVTIIGGASSHGRVSIDGGNAIASGSAHGSHHYKTNANANVSITSNKGNIAVSGHEVNVSAGYGALAEAYASGEAGTMTATANGNATLTAAGNISLNGGSSVHLHGGGNVGHNGYGEARGFNELASATAHGDVSLNAAGIVLTGARVDVSAGTGAGRQSTSPNNHVAVVRASNGTNAVASYTATANVNLTAGAAGIAITGSGEGGSVRFHGGTNDMLHQGSAFADGTKSKATATASGRVNIVDAGAFSALTNGQVNILGGRNVATHTLAEGNEGGVAALTGDAGISLSATTITIGSAGGHSAGVNIDGGGRAVSHGKATAGSYGGATLTGLSSVSMTATGALKIAGGNNIFVNVGSDGGNQASASANDHGKAAVKAGANVSLQGTSVKIASLNGIVEISAGYGVARGAQAHASYGSAAVTAAEGISLTATAGNMVLTGKGFVGVRGGGSAAAGFGTFHSFNTGSHAFGSHGSTEHTNHRVNGTSYTSATAKGTGASALVSGAAGVSLTAKKGTLAISQTQTNGGSLQLGAGTDAAFAAHASASHGATATVSGTSALSIIAGNLTVTGHRVDVFGGGGAARGASSSRDSHTVKGSHSVGTGLHPFSASHGTTFIAPKTNTAKGAGAIAKVSGDGSVTIKSGTVSLTANGASLEVSAGYGAGSHAQLKASDGGLASISAKSGVAITATVAFTAVDNGNFLGFRANGGAGGGGAVINAQGSGAKALMNVNGAVTLSAPTVTMTGANEVEIHAGSAGNRASITAGGGGSAKAVTDSSVSIKGATVSLTATASQLDISAGYGGGSHAKVAATSGQASFSAKTGVGITATTAFTAVNGGSNIFVTAAGDAGRSASMDANGAGAKALMNVDDQVTITAPTVILNAANAILIQGGSQDATHATVKAGAGGSAALTANGGVNITVATAFAANLTGANANGHIDIFGGRQGGFQTLASASGSGAKATLANDADVNITATAAGGVISIQTGAHKGAGLSINAGDQTAHSMAAQALQGTATATVSGNVNLTALLGTISLKASKGNLHLNSGNSGHMASHAFAGAGAGGKATVNVNDSINLTAAAIGLKAGTFLTGSHSSVVNAGSIGIQAGMNDLGRQALAGASYGGSAALNVSTQVNIKATGGNLNINAGRNLDVGYGCCSHHIGFGAGASASGGNAKAGLTINDGVLLQATGAVTLTAGDNISITTASGPSGAGASAGFKSQATFIQNSAINIVAGGTFTAKAGTDLSFSAGLGGGGDHAHANHAGGQATFQSDGSLNISATAVALSGGESVRLFAGGIGGWGGVADVSNGATAAFTTKRSLNVTAKNSITMTLTGKTSGGNIEVEGGSSVGLGAEAHASHNGGKATMSNIADLNLKVTGATGIITMTAGSHTGADVSIRARTVANRFTAPAAAIAGKGGSASLLDSGNVNLSAKGAITLNAGAGGSLSIVAGGGLADQAFALASSGGKATVNAQAGTNISGGTVTLTAGRNITITGASNVAESAGAHAKTGGIANLTAQDGTTIVSRGALTATAGSNLTIIGGGTSSGGHAAQSASVTAQSGNALANLTVTDGVHLTAATVALKATKGSLSIAAGSSAGRSANVHAQTHKDKAGLNVDDGIAITATGAISLNAGKSLSIDGGSDAGASASVTAGGSHDSFAAASMNATAGVDIKAGGGFGAKAANGNLFIGAGSRAGSSAFASASGHGAVTKFSANGGVNITAAAIGLTAASVPGTSPGAGSLTIAAGSFAGRDGKASASRSGNAAYSALSAVNLSATGAITLNAKAGNLTIRAGSEGFGQGHLLSFAGSAMHASGSGGGVAKAAADSSVNLTAGGALGLNAKGNIEVSGGYGEFAIVNAILGSASAALNGGVNLKAKGALTATAGGNLTLQGGNEAGIAAQQLFQFPTSLGTPPPGVVSGTVNSGVTLAAGGAVTLTAGGNLTVAAGNGETLAVGEIRSFPPSPSTSAVTFLGANHHSWGGGSANLSANLGVAVTAGTALTVTAGAAGVGSLQVLGLGKNPGASAGFQNIVSVRGGSSHAVANLTLNGNATLTAGTDVFINAAGNASIAGGALFNVRADHTVGNVTLTGSADATVHAGLDVMLNNIKGSLTLAGANAGPSGQEMLVDAHGGNSHSHSGTVNVTGHADALISAGRDILTVTALGHGLNLLAGNQVAAVAIGPASNQHAAASADASLKAGHNIVIAAAGGLNVLGGNFDAASVSGATLNKLSNGSRTAALQAHANITAGNAVKLTLTGNAFIAGGDSLNAKVSYSNASFEAGKATADAGVSIQGATVNIKVGGNLLARGGSGAKAKAFTVTGSSGGGISASASANAGVNIASKIGGVAIGVGGAASFLGGSGAVGEAYSLFSNGTANAVAHSDLHLSAATGMTLTVKGNLTVAGGPAVEQFGFVLAGGTPSFFGTTLPAFNGKAAVTATGNVQFTAGGAIAVKQSGGDLTVLGGSRGGSFTPVQAIGSNASAKLSVDSSVLIKAGTTLAFTGAHNVTLSAGLLPSSFAQPSIVTGGTGVSATANVNSSVKLTGTTVSIGHTGTFTTNSFGTVSAGGLTMNGTLTSHAAAPLLFAHTLGMHVLGPRTEMLHVAPMATQSSFGGAKTLSEMPVTDISDSTSVQPVSVDTSNGVSVDITAQTLATLQETSLVTNLVTLVGSDTAGLVAASGETGKATLFTPAISSGDYSSSFSGACVALVVSRSGQSRCSVAGGK